MKKVFRCVGILITLSLYGCHFTLRGAADNLSRVYNPMQLVSNEVAPRVSSILKRRLLQDGIHLNENDPPYRLTIHQEQIQRNILSISSGSSSRQYQLLYQLYFSFEKIKGPILLDHTSVLASRFVTINNDRILGSNDEEEHIIDDMRRDAALQIIQRINALPLSSNQTNQNKKGHL